jgi:hypothetical protein
MMRLMPALRAVPLGRNPAHRNSRSSPLGSDGTSDLRHIVGLSIALVTLASGLLYAHIGGAAFLIMAALCLLALPVCARLESSGKGDV